MSNGRPRRRSIFTGLLLILLGVLLLVHNFHPEYAIGRYLVRWWPLLLILWGVAKLTERFASQRRGENSPSPITGGEALLVLLVLLVGGALVATDYVRQRNPDLNVEWDIFSQPYSFTEQVSPQAVKPGAPVTIHVQRGNITILGDDTPEIHVSASKTANAGSEDRAREEADQVKVSIMPSGDGWRIEPMVQGGESGNVRVDLEVHVPKQSAVTAEAVRGDVSISGIGANVSVSSQRGDTDVHDLGGDLSLDEQHGDARIGQVKGTVHISGRGSDLELGDIGGAATVEGEFFGTLRFRHIGDTVRFVSSRTDMTLSSLPGRAEFDSDKLEIFDVPGSVTLLTKNKDIHLDNIRGRIQVENRHGDVDVQLREPPTDEINISDDSGGIGLTLPANSTFSLSAQSRSGEIQNDFAGTDLKSGQEGDSASLQGKIGLRGPVIRLVTSYGTIRLRKSS